MENKRGFTLIEVLLALAIIAISLTAILKTSAENISNTSRIKEKTIHHWIAMQAIKQVQMQELTIRSGTTTTKAFKIFGTTWYFRARLIPTAINRVYKITIDVSHNQYGPYSDQLVAFYHEKKL